eukprot:6952073-Pyramimonas_sp.AAC.1
MEAGHPCLTSERTSIEWKRWPPTVVIAVFEARTTAKDWKNVGEDHHRAQDKEYPTLRQAGRSKTVEKNCRVLVVIHVPHHPHASALTTFSIVPLPATYSCSGPT